MPFPPIPFRLLVPSAVWIGSALLVGCQHRTSTKTGVEPEPTAPAAAKLATPPPPVSVNYDAQIREILSLARAGSWVEAKTKAIELKNLSPNDPAVDRVHTWTLTEGQRRRDRALETEFRQIEAKDSRFANEVSDVLLDPDSRSLDLPRSLRRALDDVAKASDIPEPYGRTIERTAPMVGLDERPSALMDEALKQRMTLQVDDLTLESIVFTVGQNTGINFVADRSLPQFQRKLSVNLRDVPVSQFLDFVSRQMSLHFEVGENLVWIVDAKDAAKSGFEDTRFYRLCRGFIMPAQFGTAEVNEVRVRDKDRETVTSNRKFEDFVRDGAPPAPSIDQAIKQFFGGSKYLIDCERNIIVATGTRAPGFLGGSRRVRRR